MNRFLAASIVLLAGCLAPAEAPVEEASVAAAAGALPDLSVERLDWSGRVLHSAVDGPSHFRPTEDALWPVQQEGVLVDVPEGTTELEVALAWDGAGEFMIMLHSHKEHGTNVYVEHVSEMDDANPKCIRVPAEDVVPGVWQVMIHNRGAVDVPFTLSTLTVGAAATLVEDDRHGHWPQDGAFEIDEHAVEDCVRWMPEA